MSLHSPKEIAALAVQAGANKSRAPLANLLILGFLAGAFIATGFLLDIHVIGTLPAEWELFRRPVGCRGVPYRPDPDHSGRRRTADRQHDDLADGPVRP